MNISIRAKEGNRFYLTEKGSQVGRIKVKYLQNKGNYIHTVPKAWIENGWVVEKEEKSSEQIGRIGTGNK